MSTPCTTDLLRSRAVEAARASARAEFARWSAVLQLREALIADIEATESPMFRRMAVNATALEVGHLLHLSEQQVWRITEQASRLRDDVPTAWTAFCDGVIDAQRASTIAVAVDRLRDPASIVALDDAVVGYATEHTCGELRRWVHRLVDRPEPDDAAEADAARARRSVDVRHLEHGMSLVSGYVPTTAAVAIAKRLRTAARGVAVDPFDPRTRDQLQADLFCSWLTNATGTECDIRAEVAIVVEASALAGVTDTPARVLDPDDDLPIPAGWVLDVTDSGSTLWTRLLTDPAGHVLDVTHPGYQPPESLRRVVQWRDMTCRVRGCHHRADTADLDHHVPFDAGGPTTATNLRSLCRRHHGMKGHGLLTADAYDPPAVHVTRLPGTTLQMDYVAA